MTAAQRTTTARVIARRPLRSDAVATRRKIIDAGIALARTTPVESITMRDIARAAAVSPATAYTYFASTAHLYAEAYVESLQMLSERLRSRPPRGVTASDRVASVFRRAIAGAAETGDLVPAMAIALASSDPAVTPIRPLVDGAFDEWMDIVLGDAQIEDRAATSKALQLTMFGAFVAVAHGRLTLEDAGRVLNVAVRRLVVDRVDVPT
jgi:TetR/AcrR family transcriptional regulator, cholesterol catabolism regulator